jgi:hypothetical protein
MPLEILFGSQARAKITELNIRRTVARANPSFMSTIYADMRRKVGPPTVWKRVPSEWSPISARLRELSSLR